MLTTALAAAAIATWDPAHTRAFVVGMTEFQGDTAPTWSKTERLDGALARQLVARGVPAANVVLLQDAAATQAAIRQRLPALLEASRPGELLIVYVGSHGSRKPKSKGLVYTAFDGPISAKWILDLVDAKFQGDRALHLVDTCHSGQLAVEAAGRPRVAHAVLSSTAPSQVSWGQWRFADCLLRGFRGDARVDVDGDGKVKLSELAGYTKRHMAFVAEDWPTFWASPGFGPLVLADVAGPRPDPRVGRYVEVKWQDRWFRAEIRDTKGDDLHVHYTDYPASDDEWVSSARVRAPRFARYTAGTKVELLGDDGKWYPGRILAAGEWLHHGRYDGYGPEYDEWFGPSRIRKR